MVFDEQTRAERDYDGDFRELWEPEFSKYSAA